MAISIAGPSFVSADLIKDKLKDFDDFHLRGVVNDAIQHVSTAEHTQKVGEEAPPYTNLWVPGQPTAPKGENDRKAYGVSTSGCYMRRWCPITGQLPDPDPKDLVWSDEFGGTAVNTSNWAFETGNDCGTPAGCGFGNGELEYYLPENAAVSDGILTLTAKRESGHCPCDPATQTASGYGGDCTNGAGYCTPYTSTRMVTRGHHSFRNKRVQFRVNVASAKAVGGWTAAWMLPEHPQSPWWPTSGEIDVLETVGFKPDEFISTTHTANCNRGLARSCSTAGSFDEWHTVEVNWLKDELQFALDGQIYHTISRNGSNDHDFPFDQDFYILLNYAVGGNLGLAQGIDASAFEGDGQVMKVDWVRVYETTLPAPRCGCNSCSEAWNTAVPAAEDPTATCGSRINWAMQHEGKNEHDACALVASQFHKKCPCDPSTCASIRILEQS
ncbi:hypothetical protein ACHAWF_017618 [Thalassiosira exigua]